MNDFIRQFLPRFAALARDRIARARVTASEAARDRAEAVAHDMHAIAGEAGMLGLSEILQAARKAEATARRFGSDASLAQALSEALRDLEAAVTAVAGPA